VRLGPAQKSHADREIVQQGGAAQKQTVRMYSSALLQGSVRQSGSELTGSYALKLFGARLLPILWHVKVHLIDGTDSSYRTLLTRFALGVRAPNPGMRSGKPVFAQFIREVRSASLRNLSCATTTNMAFPSACGSPRTFSPSKRSTLSQQQPVLAYLARIAFRVISLIRLATCRSFVSAYPA
jgi:hypothetical protein